MWGGFQASFPLESAGLGGGESVGLPLLSHPAHPSPLGAPAGGLCKELPGQLVSQVPIYPRLSVCPASYTQALTNHYPSLFSPMGERGGAGVGCDFSSVSLHTFETLFPLGPAAFCS